MLKDTLQSYVYGRAESLCSTLFVTTAAYQFICYRVSKVAMRVLFLHPLNDAMDSCGRARDIWPTIDADSLATCTRGFPTLHTAPNFCNSMYFVLSVAQQHQERNSPNGGAVSCAADAGCAAAAGAWDCASDLTGFGSTLTEGCAAGSTLRASLKPWIG